MTTGRINQVAANWGSSARLRTVGLDPPARHLSCEAKGVLSRQLFDWARDFTSRHSVSFHLGQNLPRLNRAIREVKSPIGECLSSRKALTPTQPNKKASEGALDCSTEIS